MPRWPLMQRPPRFAAGKPDARRGWVRDGHASDRRAPSARAATQPRPGHAAERHALLRLRHDLVQPPRRSARHVGTLRSLPRRAPHRATPRRRATPVRVAGRPRVGLGGGDRSLLLSRDACQLRRRMYSNIPVAAGGEMSERTVEGWVMDRAELREHDPARYHDDVVQQDGRWLIKRREEIPLQFKAGPPPMSDTAMAVSAGTLKE